MFDTNKVITDVKQGKSINLPRPHGLAHLLSNWLRELDLNQYPSGYEPDALPIKLSRDIFMRLFLAQVNLAISSNNHQVLIPVF